MESAYLKTLVEVARVGSITRAAEILCVTQSAVSRRIKFLEEQYGSLLLDRSGAVLTPTPAGRLVIGQAQKILEIEQELRRGLNYLEKKKELAFVCTPTFGIVHLPGILREFMLACGEAGDLKFVFDMPERVVKGLKEGLFDLAVVEHCECFDLSEFEAVPLPGDEMVFAGSPGLGISSPAELDLLLQQTLFSRNEGCCSRTLLENNLRRLGRETSEFRRIIVYDDLHHIVRSLLHGEGIAFISSDIVKEHVESGALVEFRVDGFVHQRRRTFIFNGRLPAKSLAEQFVSQVLHCFDSSLPENADLPCCG